MNEQELNLLLSKVSEQTATAIKTQLADAMKGVVKADDLAAQLEAVGLSKKSIDELTLAVEKQGLEIGKMTAGKQLEAKSLDQIFAEKSDAIKSLATNDSRIVKFEIPIKTIVGTASVGSSTIGMRLPEIGQIATLGTVMTGLFRHRPVEEGMNKTIRYIDRTTSTNNAAGRSETTGTGTGTFGESAIAWTEYSLAIPEIGDSIPVSKESFRFVSFIRGEVETLLSNNLALKEDAYYWSGTGTPPVSKGIYTYANTFVPATYAATTGSWLPGQANLYDLAQILAEQVSNGYQSKYMPNLVLLNPGDQIAMLGTKNGDGDYIKHPLMSADGRFLGGLEIVTSSQVTKGTCLVGDRRFATIYDAENVVVEMGYVGNQFVEGAMTLRAYKSTGILVRNSDVGAFLKCTDITAALADINDPING